MHPPSFKEAELSSNKLKTRYLQQLGIKEQQSDSRIHDNSDEQRQDDVNEQHDEAVQVDPGEAVDHRSQVGDHAERRKHVVTW